MLPDWWTNREDWREARKLAARRKTTEDLASVFEEPVLPLAEIPTVVAPEERPQPIEVFQGQGFKVRLYQGNEEYYGLIDFATKHATHFSARDENLDRLRLTLATLGAQNATKADIEAAPIKGPSNCVPSFDVTFHERSQAPLSLADGDWFPEE